MAVRGLRGSQPTARVKEYVDGYRGAHLNLKSEIPGALQRV